MPGNPFTDPNWAADLADTVERVVATVRDKTTKPLVTVTRGLVYGLLDAILGVATIVLLILDGHARPAGAPRPVQGAPFRCGVHQLPRGRWNLQPRRLVGTSEALFERLTFPGTDSPAHDRINHAWRQPDASQRRHHRLRPRRTHGRHLHRARQPRAARHRGRALEHERPARRSAHAHHRRRELPRVSRRHHGARADEQVPRAGRSASAPSSSPRRSRRSTSRRARSRCSCTTRCTRPTPSSSAPARNR